MKATSIFISNLDKHYGEEYDSEIVVGQLATLICTKPLYE
jgi:hypothetical protein